MKTYGDPLLAVIRKEWPDAEWDLKQELFADCYTLRCMVGTVYVARRIYAQELMASGNPANLWMHLADKCYQACWDKCEEEAAKGS